MKTELSKALENAKLTPPPNSVTELEQMIRRGEHVAPEALAAATAREDAIKRVRQIEANRDYEQMQAAETAANQLAIDDISAQIATESKEDDLKRAEAGVVKAVINLVEVSNARLARQNQLTQKVIALESAAAQNSRDLWRVGSTISADGSEMHQVLPRAAFKSAVERTRQIVREKFNVDLI